MRSPVTAARLYPGERVVVAEGLPSLTWFAPGTRPGPLVVFVPGAGHLGRIAYGHPEGDPRDFVAHWVAQSGLPFLAVSYPLDNPVYETLHPEFDVAAWGRLTAQVAAQVVAEHGLEPRLLCLTWSMAGQVAHALGVAASQVGLEIELLVAVAATAPLPGLNATVADTLASARAPSGLASIGFYLDTAHGGHDFLSAIAAQANRAGHPIIPPDVFLSEYLGDTPVALWGTSVRPGDGAFSEDLGAALDDLGTFDFAAFPPIALVVGDDPHDARHALTDQGAWTLHLTQALCARALGSAAVEKLSPARWRSLLELVRGAPTRLTREVSGNHFLLLGQPGARAVADAVVSLHRDWSSLRGELADALD